MKKLRMPAYITRALSLIEDTGKRAWPVGGCVRDSVMGRCPVDYDVATDALPEETKRIFNGFTVIETGIKHGTVTVMIDSHPIEITTLRRDGEYSDSRHPASVSFTDSLKEDLARRDFTVNAMAYSDRDGIVDPFGGRADIENSIIRCVGDPEKRFSEDALRILRMLRFSSVLGFTPECKTAEAARKLASGLTRISRERVRDELVKLLCGKNVLPVLSDFADIISVIIPELKPCIGFDQKSPHHVHDVYGHCIHAVDSAPPTPEMRLAALLHDIEKPACFFIGADGNGHCRGHAQRSAKTAKNILTVLRFDTKTIFRTVRLIELHDSYPKPNRAAVRRDIANCGPELWYRLEALRKADSAAKAPGAYGDENEYFRKVRRLADAVIKDGDCISLASLAVDGNDIRTLTDDGKTVGNILDSLLEAVINGSLQNERDQLIAKAKQMLTK